MNMIKAIGLSAVQSIFIDLFGARAVKKWMEGFSKTSGLSFYERIYTLRVTLWYLVFQRLHGEGTLDDWSVMRVVVGFCALTGVVLSAAEAALGVSEQVLAWNLIQNAAVATVWIGDRNFGVWSVVAKALLHEQDLYRSVVVYHIDG